MAKYCGNCGNKLDDDAKVCDQCGTIWGGQGGNLYEKSGHYFEKRKLKNRIGFLLLGMILVIGIIKVISGHLEKQQPSQIVESVKKEDNIDAENELTGDTGDKNLQNNDQEETISDSLEKIPTTSKVNIINAVEDGTLWAVETDELEQKYIVHTNVYGEILGKTLYQYDGYMECGLTGEIFAIGTKDDNGEKTYRIYDINSGEDISTTYKGDFDDIISIIQTEQENILIARKIFESFEEKYACLKMVDSLGNEIFNISLDKNTLLNEYNIDVTDSTEDIEVEYAGNNVYYIPYIASQFKHGVPNSLVIDLNRNKVIPVDFPQHNGLYCCSDGNYTVVYSPMHGQIIVDNEKGIYEGFSTGDYYPGGEIVGGVFCAYGALLGNEDAKVFMDIQGNIITDLNQYPQDIKSVWLLKDDVALVQFTNSYMTYININGEFLFEPIKGTVESYYADKGIAIVFVEDELENKHYKVIDRNGNITNINIELSGSGYWQFVEYNGKQYLVSGSESGIQEQEYTTTD